MTDIHEVPMDDLMGRFLSPMKEGPVKELDQTVIRDTLRRGKRLSATHLVLFEVVRPRTNMGRSNERTVIFIGPTTTYRTVEEVIRGTLGDKYPTMWCVFEPKWKKPGEPE